MRFISLLLTSMWIGGLLALGYVAAPAAFDVMKAHDPANGRALAGELFGVMLLRSQHWLIGFGAVQAVLLNVRAALGPRPRQYKAQLAIVLLMIAVTGYAAFVIAPKIEAIRVAAHGPIAALADDNPVKAQFGRLHGWSNGLMALTLVGAVSLFWLDRRE
ncbi:MAG: DUF4149 domain-containing protein [Acidobacteria bacterium]|nr:MAG: DUF4149 domain-containing protein [Acidobacteriota bacterium]